MTNEERIEQLEKEVKALKRAVKKKNVDYQQEYYKKRSHDEECELQFNLRCGFIPG